MFLCLDNVADWYHSSKVGEIFDRILRDIIRMSRDQIEAVNTSNRALGLRVQRILFVGGLSGSPHARAALKSAFSSDTGPFFDYPIEVVTPHQNSWVFRKNLPSCLQLTERHRSTLISLGAVLASLHHDTIGEYYLRCSFGVALDEPYDKRVHTERYRRTVHGDAKILTDYHDGVKIVEKRIRWLYKAVSHCIKKQQSLILSQSRACKSSWRNRKAYAAG